MENDRITEQAIIFNRITSFLAGEKLDACYGTASDKDVEMAKKEINEIFSAIIAAKFEGDEDNCFPVESWVVNRKVERFPCSHSATGYRHGMTTPEIKRALSRARVNRDQVLEEVKTLEYIIDDRERARGGVVGRLVRHGMHPLKATLIAYDIDPSEYGMSMDFVEKVNSGERVLSDKDSEKIAEWLGVRPETIAPETYAEKEGNTHSRKW